MIHKETFVSKGEKIVDKFEVEQTKVYYTDKRLYIVKETGENTDEEVVERSQITGVHIKKEAPLDDGKVGFSGFLIAIALIVGGIFINSWLKGEFSDYPDGLFAWVLCPIGAILLIINIISLFVKSKKQYSTSIEINTTSHTISIPVPTTDDLAYLASIRVKLFKLLNENNLASEEDTEITAKTVEVQPQGAEEAPKA